MTKYILISAMIFVQPSFKHSQLRNERVQVAYHEKEGLVKSYFTEKKISYNDFKLFIRAFKKEQQLEVWVAEKQKKTYTLLHTYAVCASSGILGPKRKEGDQQVPEGVYSINHFNPQSKFHLSLGLNYPNESDLVLSDKSHPGSDIYIHGDCVTIGCLPLTDEKIKELYVMAVEAYDHGQENIPVHIFPARLSKHELDVLTHATPSNADFWRNLKIVYDDFERTKKLSAIRINKSGEYRL